MAINFNHQGSNGVYVRPGTSNAGQLELDTAGTFAAPKLVGAFANGTTFVAGEVLISSGTDGTMTKAQAWTYGTGANGGLTQTGTGATAFTGNIGQTGVTTFSTGTGVVSLNGDTTHASAKHLTSAGGAANFNWSASSGTFSTGTGAIALNGDSTVASAKHITAAGGASNFNWSASSGTFSTGTGAVALNGDTTVASAKSITSSGGAANFNWSASSGTFSTGTGVVTVGGGTNAVNIGTVANFGTITLGHATGSNLITLNGGVIVGSGKTLTLGADATTGLQAVSYQQWQSGQAGLKPKTLVKAATAAALPACVYANGSGGVGATLTESANGALTVDGIAVAVNDRILVKDQALAFQNGIYVVTATGSGVAVFVLTRTTDADTWNNLVGAYMFAEQGTANGDKGFFCTSDAGGTLGTNNVTFSLFSNSAVAYTWDAGLVASGNSISVDIDDVTLGWDTGTANVSSKVVLKDVSGLSAQGSSVIPKVQWNAKGQITVGTPAVAADVNTLYNSAGLVVGGLNSRFGTAAGHSNYTMSLAGSGNMGTAGDSESGLVILYGTGSAGTVRLSSDGAAAGAGNQIVLDNNSSMFFRAHVLVREPASDNTLAYVIEGVAERAASAGTTAVILSTQTVYTEDALTAANWDVTVAADTTLGSLNISVTNSGSALTVKATSFIQVTMTKE